MGIRFFTDNWLTASAGVGLLRVLEHTGYILEDFVNGNTVELSQEILQNLGKLYNEYLFKEFKPDDSWKASLREKRKKNEKTDVYTEVVYKRINDFFSNSPLTNQSKIKHVKEITILPLDDEDKAEMLVWENKGLIEDFIKDRFQEILNYPRSNKICFFCRERHAYKKNGKVKILDATNFTPLTASPDTVENFFWEGRSNMYLCPECEIFLYFSAFGFHKTPMGTYLFVYMPDLENTKRINDLLRTETGLKSFMDKTIVEASKIIEGRKAEWILRNIYIVEIEKVKDAQSNIYTLSMSQRLAKAIKENIGNYPKHKGFGDLFSIFLAYIYSGRSLYEFIYKILSGFFYRERYKKLTKRRDIQLVKMGMNFKNYLPYSLTYFIKFQEVLDMEDKERISKQINWAYREGLTLKEIYEKSKNIGKEKAKRKIEGISYRLLDAIRRRDTDAFQQNLIRAYLEVEREIPYIFVEALKDGSFNRIAYAFLIGLNGKAKEEEE